MNIASRTRGFIAASFALVGLATAPSHAQTTLNVNGTSCPAASVTLGAGTINISTSGCGGTAAQAPIISGLSVNFGVPGDPVTINGNNLAGASVTIRGVLANITSNTATQIVTSVPAGATAGAGSLVVTTNTAPTASTAFTVNAPPTVPPSINPADAYQRSRRHRGYHFRLKFVWCNRHIW